MEKKIVFFDIDGTLWDSTNIISDSTVYAIKKLKENGHMTFINSGRSRGYIIAPNLLELGFDGIVSGCGTMVEIGDEIAFSYELDKELMLYTIEVLRSQNAHIILEGKEYLYVDTDYFEKDPHGLRVMKAMGDRLRTVDECFGEWEISKMSLVVKDSDIDVLHNKLDKYFTFMQHTSDICELVPIGFDKGTGIVKVCELTGIPIENTYAFGDSINDKEMMSVVGHPIAMGNGTDSIKAMCEYTTASLYEDGILKGCEYFGLI